METKEEKIRRQLHEEYKHRGYVKESYFNTVLFGMGLFCIVLILVCSMLSHRSGYKDGQIDYYNKIIKWKLVDNPDGTKEWKQVVPNPPERKYWRCVKNADGTCSTIRITKEEFGKMQLLKDEDDDK